MTDIAHQHETSTAPVAPDNAARMLQPLARASLRRSLHVDGRQAACAFVGYDLWNDYEISWLDLRGKPQIAVLEIVVPSNSPNTMELGATRRYFDILRNRRFESIEAFEARVAADLSQCTEAYVLVRATPVRLAVRAVQPFDAINIDAEDVAIGHGGVDVGALCTKDVPAGESSHECLTSDLLASRCPLTGAVDCGTIWIDYEGARLCRRGLLQYLLSFRDSGVYHEQCVERIFVDILARGKPERLTVGARFTRRHGIDINPVRSTHGVSISNRRTVRQ